LIIVNKQKVPDYEFAWHIEGDNGIDDILTFFSTEEVLFLFTCIVQEIAVVFVSRNQSSISSSM
jgi:hypothetical protein